MLRAVCAFLFIFAIVVVMVNADINDPEYTSDDHKVNLLNRNLKKNGPVQGGGGQGGQGGLGGLLGM